MTARLPRSTTAALAGALLLLSSVWAVAQTPAPAPADAGEAAARRLYTTKTCLACHGREGKKAIGDYPELAGQRPDYMVAQIKDILDGKRTGSPDASGNPRSKGMRGALIDPNGNRRIADGEIEQIVRWLAALEPKKPEPPAEPMSPARRAEAAKLYTETCEVCHGKTGREPQDGFPVIAGQKRSYALIQMQDIKAKARTNGMSEAMQAMLAELKNEQLELLADFVSQLDPAKP